MGWSGSTSAWDLNLDFVGDSLLVQIQSDFGGTLHAFLFSGAIQSFPGSIFRYSVRHFRESRAIRTFSYPSQTPPLREPGQIKVMWMHFCWIFR